MNDWYKEHQKKLIDQANKTQSKDQDKIVWFEYKNYRGETATRTVIPISIEFKATEYHPEKQWIMTAYDLEKKANRDFAVLDIQGAMRKISDPVKLKHYLKIFEIDFKVE